MAPSRAGGRVNLHFEDSLPSMSTTPVVHDDSHLDVMSARSRGVSRTASGGSCYPSHAGIATHNFIGTTAEHHPLIKEQTTLPARNHQSQVACTVSRFLHSVAIQTESRFTARSSQA